MQLVGSTCSVCSKRISFAPDGASCPNCSITFHLACLTTAGACPTCGGDFARLTSAQEQSAATTHAQAISWGRKVVLTVCAALLLAQVLFIATAFLGGSATPALVVQSLVALAFIAALYFGYGWARIWLGLSCGLGAIVALSFAWSRAASVGTAAALGAIAVVFGASCVLLLFSSRVASFIASQRQAT